MNENQGPYTLFEPIVYFRWIKAGVKEAAPLIYSLVSWGLPLQTRALTENIQQPDFRRDPFAKPATDEITVRGSTFPKTRN